MSPNPHSKVSTFPVPQPEPINSIFNHHLPSILAPHRLHLICTALHRATCLCTSGEPRHQIIHHQHCCSSSILYWYVLHLFQSFLPSYHNLATRLFLEFYLTSCIITFTFHLHAIQSIGCLVTMCHGLCCSRPVFVVQTCFTSLHTFLQSLASESLIDGISGFLFHSLLHLAFSFTPFHSRA